MNKYLFSRKQVVKINDSFSPWSEILLGVRQRSILRPLLLNTFICDIFCVIVNFKIPNYADDSTPFGAKLDGRSIVDELEISSSILFTCLEDNYMKANIEKSHDLLSGKKNFTPNIDGKVIESKDIKFYLVQLLILTSHLINILAIYVKMSMQS